MTHAQTPSIQADLAALRAEITTLRAEQARRKRRGSWPRRLAAALVATLLVAVMPLTLLGANFQDLNPGSPHNADINLVADAGISKGCTDQQHYCPNNLVTREQMASFLARTAGLGNNPPIANALTAVNAANAATLQGKGADDFLPATGDTWQHYPFYNAFVAGGQVVMANQAGPTTRVTRLVQGSGLGTVHLPLEAPARVFGKPLNVKLIQVCFKTHGSAQIVATRVHQSGIGDNSVVIGNSTNRSAPNAACYAINLGDAVPVTGALYLVLELNLPISTDSVDLYSARLVLTP